MKLEKTHWIGIGTGLTLASGSIFLLLGSNLMYFLLAVSLVISILPFMIGFLSGQSRYREKEEKFLEFTRDLVENAKSGTPITKSIMNLGDRNYGTLTDHVAKLANQLSIGITLNNAFKTFAKDTKSDVIARAVDLISEAERSGGQIDVILGSVSTSINQIDQLRKERKAAISNLVTQGYLIFFIFIIIMLVLEFKILPLVSGLGGTEGLSIATSAGNSDELSAPLFVMILVQSFFAGLVIGKIAEGSVKNGFKHSFILLAITLLITTGAKVLFK